MLVKLLTLIIDQILIMKQDRNIHILPTDKPSRFSLNSSGKYHLTNQLYTNSPNFTNQNIYITSDEIFTEYSRGLYFIDIYTGRNDIFSPLYINKDTIAAGKFHAYMNNGNMCKKIIMTTDPILILNGVQPIDDKFLEWFVKNPSCEFVEVDYKYDTNLQPILDSFGNKVLRIKIPTESSNLSQIIIPQEEPMSYEEFRKNASNDLIRKFDTDCSKYSEDGHSDNYFYANCKYWENKLKEEPINPNNQEVMFHEEHQEYFYEDIINDKKVTVWLGKDYVPKEEPKQGTMSEAIKQVINNQLKQETLEEAADKLSDELHAVFEMNNEDAFLWILNILNKGATWQAKTMFNEEEIHKIVESYQNTMENNPTYITYNQWFEQFKKK